jgi:hypothetical protein
MEILRATPAPKKPFDTTSKNPLEAPVLQASDALLGKSAKSSPPTGYSSSGKSLQKPDPETSKKLALITRERYGLMDAARALVCYQGKQENRQYPATYHRVGECRYQMLGSLVGVGLTPENRAHLLGVATCGSVWACPVCTALIQEGRRKEIAKAIDWAYAGGFQPAMVTFTFPHRLYQSLAELIEAQAQAFKLLRKGANWDRFKKSVVYNGLIRSLELTYGTSGWHPHTHELFFVSSEAEADDMRLRLTELWLSACVRAGLVDIDDVDQVRDFRAHAVDVRGWCQASDYLAKQDSSRHWGVDRELAKASTKQGRAKGQHPFGLLALAAEGGKQAGAKYLEYIAAMKGKRQLFWSHGLKARVGLQEKSDLQLADEIPTAPLCLFDAGHWHRVLAKRQRAQLLLAAERGGAPAVQVFLERLRL